METSKLSDREKKSILTACLIGAFLTPFVLSSVNIAIPQMAEELRLTISDMANLSIYFLITSFSFLLPAAKIADIYGRIKTLKAGFALFGFFSALCSISENSYSLLTFRAAQGAGSALIFANVMAVITSAFPKGERGRAIGLAAASIYLGLTLGPFLGGMLLKFFSWKIIFQLSSGLSFTAWLAASLLIKSEFIAGEGKFNILNTAIYLLLALIFSFSFSNISKMPFLFFLSSFFLFLFLRKDFSSGDSFGLKPLIANKAYTFALIAAFFHYAGTFSLTFIFSLYLQYYLGLNPQKAGLILFLMPLFMMIFSPIAGKYSDSHSPGKIASSGIAVSFLGIAIAFINGSPGVFLSALLLSLIGAGFAFFSSPNTNSAMSSLDFNQYSSGSAFLSAARLFGQNISMVLAGYIMKLMLADNPVTINLPAFVKSFRIILSGGVLFLFSAAYFSLKRIRNER
ncbi:MAG: MFS transporter [Elusimicrobiota bacterium]